MVGGGDELEPTQIDTNPKAWTAVGGGEIDGFHGIGGDGGGIVVAIEACDERWRACDSGFWEMKERQRSAWQR